MLLVEVENVGLSLQHIQYQVVFVTIPFLRRNLVIKMVLHKDL